MVKFYPFRQPRIYLKYHSQFPFQLSRALIKKKERKNLRMVLVHIHEINIKFNYVIKKLLSQMQSVEIDYS